MATHYITNVEADVSRDSTLVRAQFYKIMQFPGSTELSCCGTDRRELRPPLSRADQDPL
jgi:hypothetical protein